MSRHIGARIAVDVIEHVGGLFDPPACDDGLDNDGDGAIDSPGDVGCYGIDSASENPDCQDGLDNDGDGLVDFDGGASVNGGVPWTDPDPACNGIPWLDREASRACGLGGELGLVVAAVAVLRRRFRRRPRGSP